MMKSADGGVAGSPENRLTARSNDPHQALTGVERPRKPGVDRGRPAAERCPVLGEHPRRPGRHREVRADLLDVVGRVLLVLVQRDGPGDFLRRQVHGDRPHRRQHLAGNLAHRPVRGERDLLPAAVAVLDQRRVIMQVEGDHQHAVAARRGQRGGLPAARRQPQRGVLQLRLWRREVRRQLAENLGVRVQRVAGRAPIIVGQ
jgi:hypothetical protein